MRYIELKDLASKTFFTSKDVAELLNIKENSALVLCNRYVKKGLFVRLKKDFYILKESLMNLDQKSFFKIANFIQIPSYISLMTALSFYELTTQVQRGFFESICIKRSAKFEIDDISFNFYKIKKDLYLDFIKIDDFFIATKEKAFLDIIYLTSIGRYTFDIDSIDFDKLDLKKLKKLLLNFPKKTLNLVNKICKI